MTTISMDEAGMSGLFSAPAMARPPTMDQYTQPGMAGDVRRRHRQAAHLHAVRSTGDTARGKPPPVSARFVVGLQWALFAACAVRILVLSP
jgi:hypothetical protein